MSKPDEKMTLKKVYEKLKTRENWSKIVFIVCVAAVAIDPLFFFIPVIDSQRLCLTLDKKLGVAVCVLRTFVDTFYLIHIIVQYINGKRNSRLYFSRVISRERNRRFRYIDQDRNRRFRYVIVDVVSVLPIPQMVVLTLIPRKQYTSSLVTKQILKWVMICHNIPRVIRIYPLFKEVTRTTGTVTETKWIGAALNLCLYMVQSHVFGAFWYLGAIEKNDKCWRQACATTPGCNVSNLYCARSGDKSLIVNTSCPLIDPGQITNSTVFNFGIYIEALKSGMLESMDFPRKFFFCFWWGLRNLSALGQNLETDNSIGEIFFAIFICVSGLFLFAVLIGNVQKYLQSTTTKVDDMEEKKRDRENWMSNRMLPEDMKKRIRKYEDYRWQETRGTEEETLLRNLPKSLKLEIKRYLYLKFLRRVALLRVFDDRLLDELCVRLKTVFYTEHSYILREGEPVEEMFFIMRGNLISSTKNRSFEKIQLKAYDFCGDLLPWALNPHSSHLPNSSTTVQAQTEVEGFVLIADDLKFAVTKYPCVDMDYLRHKFRYNSVQWQTWAACFIQAAWKRHCRRKLSKALREEENKLQNTLHQNDDSTSGGHTLNSGATFMRRGLL